MKQEIQRRKTNRERLREFFEARPAEWINAVDLEPIAGRQAWRTRVSELRRALESEQIGTIENALSRNAHGEVVRSAYRYLPHVPLGRDAAKAIPQTWDRGPFTPEFKLTPPTDT